MKTMNPCIVLYTGQSIFIPNKIPIPGYFGVDESGNQLKISPHADFFLISDTQVKDLGNNQSLVTDLSHLNGASRETNFQLNEALIHCSNCNNNFEDINQYKEHEKTHHSKKLFECNSCHEKFNKMCLYRKHLSTHKESKLFECVICETGFNIENNYKVHMALHGNSLVCPICNLPFQRKASLKSHLATHQVEEIHTCRECASEFNNLVDLSIHLKTHTIDSEQKLICRFCKVRFDTLRDLKSHVADHMKVKKVILNVTKPKKEVAIKKLKHKCNVCEKAFSKYCLLTRHMRIHNGERPFLCSICFKSFTQKVSLNIHLMKHTGIKPFCCTLCPAKFYQKCNLKVHVEKTHTATAEGEKNFKCTECDCIFKKLASLNTHVKKNHSDRDLVNVMSVIDQLKNLEKQLDGKSVEQEKKGKTKHSVESMKEQHKENAEDISDNYQVHTLRQKVDGVNKVYVCSYCSKEAKKPSDLIRHIRTHTKEKPFKCHCGDSFALKTTLQSHMRSHIEKKCEICSKVFISTKQFRAHLRKHEVTCAVPVELKQSNGAEIAKNTVSKGRSRLGTKISTAKYPLCSMAFKSPEILESHAQTNGSNGSLLECNNFNLIECLYCKGKFENLISFQKHIDTHEPQKIQESEQNEPDTVGPEESSSFLNQILQTPANIIHYNNDPLTLQNDNIDLLKKSLPLVETEANEDMQTFLVDYPEVQNGDYLTNYFVSQSDNKIILNTIDVNNDQSPLIFNVENIITKNDNVINKNDSSLISNGKSSDAGLCRTVDVSQIIPSHGSSSSFESVDNGSEHDVSNRYLSDSLYLYPTTETIMDTGQETGPANDDISADRNQDLTNETQENDGLSVIHCLNCKKMFKNSVPYLAHMNSCNKSSPESSCEKSQEEVKQNCDKEESGSAKSNINPKIKKNLICVHCKKEFSNRGIYMLHIKCHHKKGNGLHKCDYCDREFKKPSDLGRHLRTHTGERPFQCDKCDKKFSLKSTLEGHYRTHNPTANKSFLCEVCNSFFSSKASRKLHMHVHTGLQPHKCSFCDQHFRTAAHKKSHEKKIHLSNKKKREHSNSKRITNILATAVDMAVGEIQNEKRLSEQETPDHPEIQVDLADPKFATDAITIDPALLLIRTSNVFLEGMDQELMPGSVTVDDLVPSKASDMISSDDCVKDNMFTKSLIMDNYFSIINQDSLATKESTQFVMKKCSQCTKYFVSNEDLLQHEKSHSLGMSYSCFICDLMLDDAEELGNHLQSVHAIEGISVESIPWEG